MIVTDQLFDINIEYWSEFVLHVISCKNETEVHSTYVVFDSALGFDAGSMEFLVSNNFSTREPCSFPSQGTNNLFGGINQRPSQL